MATRNGEKVEFSRLLKSFLGKLYTKPVEMGRKMKELGQEDPRRAVRSFKVALALTFVSLFYYFQPLYEIFGDNAMWGATLGKGLNRMMATMAAGAMGLAAHGVAHRSGKTTEPLLLGFFMFIIGMKTRYGYRLVVFNLTFCLVSISGYRETEAVKMAFQRVSTIIFGSLMAMVACLCICPVWCGNELHISIASNMENLGDFLEGFAAEYFEKQENGQRKKDDEAALKAYRTVLTSKNNEETMTNLARWEPCHKGFRFRHPWKQYLKTGTLTRECA